ncbi:unnamed protein product [Adineta steineri]|uniref:G-protein coupled receptors family 1 profile domain-containing protein n=1 Tax=Adineta steineri TaxID=433720 RepID=A0A813RK11_9BILA|nr:unnamed protein product [Adineta steineri]CAF3898225.1 unnamed protein product [Adineta steineri]
MSNSTAIVDCTFNLISLVLDTIAIFTCVIYLCAIVYRFIEVKYRRGHIIIDIPLILTINIICAILIKSTLQIIHVTVPTLIKDFQIMNNFQDVLCYRFRAYVLWSMVGVLYWSYTLLAFFRFTRVIYSTKLWLRRLSLYLYILIPCQYIFVFISLLPSLVIFNNIDLIPNEAYCGIVYSQFYASVYETAITFSIPFSIVGIFYTFIVRKMRETTAIRQGQELDRRDYIVIRRMGLNMMLLSMMALPFMIIYIKDIIQNHYESILYRVQWLSSSVGSGLFSITLPFITTRLRDILKPNGIAPINNQHMT